MVAWCRSTTCSTCSSSNLRVVARYGGAVHATLITHMCMLSKMSCPEIAMTRGLFPFAMHVSRNVPLAFNVLVKANNPK